MPPVVAAGAIGAAGSLAGGILGSRSADKATKANLTAQREALAYEKQKDAERKAEYDKALKLHEAQMGAWQANRRALARRYGIEVPEPSQGAPMGQPGPQMGQPGMAGPGRALTLGAIAGGPRPSMEAPPMAPEGMNPEDPYAWNDWSRYAPVR